MIMVLSHVNMILFVPFIEIVSGAYNHHLIIYCHFGVSFLNPSIYKFDFPCSMMHHAEIFYVPIPFFFNVLYPLHGHNLYIAVFILLFTNQNRKSGILNFSSSSSFLLLLHVRICFRTTYNLQKFLSRSQKSVDLIDRHHHHIDSKCSIT